MERRLLRRGAIWIAAAGTCISAWITSPSPVAGQGTGALAGTVDVRLPAPRRSANRYPGSTPAVHPVQEVPVLVWIEGSVPGAPAGRPTAARVVAQQDTAFVPALTVVPVGSSVAFPNEDPFFHNVFSYSGPARFDLGRYPRGESKDVTFDEPGVVKVYCEVHEFMRAAILVAENPFHAVLEADGGSYRLEGIPPGSYRAVFWHVDLGSEEREVQIRAGGVARLDVELR